MNKLPARAGWDWIKQGAGMYRRHAGALSALFVIYLFMMLSFCIIPIFGVLIAIGLIPVYMAGFLQACAEIDAGRALRPAILLCGFQKPVFGPLFKLGFAYLFVILGALGVAALTADGALSHMMVGVNPAQLDPKAQAALLEKIRNPVLLGSALMLLGILALSFCAPLVYWQRMPLGKALFFSIVATLRMAKVFLVFVLSLFSIYWLASLVIALLFGPSEIAIVLMMPVMIACLLIMQCALYVAYCQLFGAPACAAKTDTAA